MSETKTENQSTATPGAPAPGRIVPAPPQAIPAAPSPPVPHLATPSPATVAADTQQEALQADAPAAPTSDTSSNVAAALAAKNTAVKSKPTAKALAKQRPKPAAKRTPDPVLVEVPPMATPARLRMRHKGLVMAFVVMVLLPLALTIFYLETRAEDQYASTLAFTVRSEELKSATDILGGMGAAFGGGGSKDSDILYEFIRSQEMVTAVDAKLNLRRLYSLHRDTDPIFTFPPDGAIEDLTSYWERMVRISYDSGSGLLELQALAFTAEDARAIAEAIHAESTARINSLSAIAREDALRYASEDLTLALDRLKGAREAITAFRLKNRIVDVNADIQGQMGLLNTLQAQLAAALIDYDLLRQSARDGDPRLEQAQSRIRVIQDRIADERDKFGTNTTGGDAASYATTVAEFERLTVEREFAETTYLAALQALDAAKAEANRQTRYLATYIHPTLAQTAEFPQRLVIIALVALFSFLIWVIGSLIFYALRDRH